jgi:hypothetical protein
LRPSGTTLCPWNAPATINNTRIAGGTGSAAANDVLNPSESCANALARIIVSFRRSPMPLRLRALDEGPDICIDGAMIVVGRHPLCDFRLESFMVSSRHCCMSPIGDELRVEDMASTNGIRINGYRVDGGRLRPGDELSIAAIRYKLIDDQGLETTLDDPVERGGPIGDGQRAPTPVPFRVA